MAKQSKKHDSDPVQKNGTKCSVSRHLRPEITPTQSKILGYISTTGINSTESLRAKFKYTSSYIRRVKRELRELGLLRRIPAINDPVQYRGGSTREPEQNPEQKEVIRLHAMEFKITPIVKFRNYPVGAVLTVKGHHVHVHENEIIVQQNEPKKGGFFGSDERAALKEATHYWELFWNILEVKLDCELWKDGHSNIKITKNEYATIDSMTAETIDKRGDRLMVYKGGKLRFSTDKSDTFEHETHFPPSKGGLQESEAGNIIFNDILDFYKHEGVPRLSEMALLLKRTMACQAESAAGMAAIIKMQQPALSNPMEKNPKRSYHG